MSAPGLARVEIKAFLAAADDPCTQAVYTAIGVTGASDGGAAANFDCGDCAFLLQRVDGPAHTASPMTRLPVENADDRHRHLAAERIGVRIGRLQDQPWGLRGVANSDPSAVLWRIAMNTPRQEAG